VLAILLNRTSTARTTALKRNSKAFHLDHTPVVVLAAVAAMVALLAAVDALLAAVHALLAAVDALQAAVLAASARAIFPKCAAAQGGPPGTTAPPPPAPPIAGPAGQVAVDNWIKGEGKLWAHLFTGSVQYNPVLTPGVP
jgi:hypothetical protein